MSGADRASTDQVMGILLAAGRLLIRHRGINLHRLSRNEANRIRLSLEHELTTGVRIAQAPPPDTRKRKRRTVSELEASRQYGDERGTLEDDE